MSSDPIQGEPRRRLIRVTRQRVALAAAAVLAALWLAIVEQLHAGKDPVIKEVPASTTTTTTTTTPETDTSGKTETTQTGTSTTETTTTQTSTSASTSTTSQS